MKINRSWIGKNCALLLVIALAGCDLHKTVKSADGKLEVKVPFGWAVTTIPNSKVKLTVKKSSARKYVSFNVETKATLKRYELKTYAQSCMTSAGRTSTLTNRVVAPPQDVTVNGKPAIRYQVTGTTAQGNNDVYYHVFFESPTSYVQALWWSGASDYDQEAFDGIMASLVEH